MPRRRSKKKAGAAGPTDADPATPAAPAPNIGTGIGDLLRRAGLSRVSQPPPTLPPPGPSPPSRVPPPPDVALPEPPAARPRARHSAGDQAALDAAYRGVQPIRRRRGSRAAPQAKAPTGGTPQDAAARARLDALVSGALRFDVQWHDDGSVEGLRQGGHERSLARLRGAGLSPEATLDLHGLSRAEVTARVTEFVRKSARRGLRLVLVIVGKGLHSEDGHGVLAEALVEALTTGGAAPRVAAFASAHTRHGGYGAIAVELRDAV